MHQVIGKKLAILGFEPPQQGDKRHRTGSGPKPRSDPGPDGTARAPDQRPRQQRQQQLPDQHAHRIKRGNHRPLSQPHEAPQRSRGNIGPRRAHQLQIGAGDRRLHAVAHDVGPDQHLDIRLCRGTVDTCIHVPAVMWPLGGGLQREVVVGNCGLRGPFLAIQLAIAARVNRVVAGDVEHPATCDCMGMRTAHHCTFWRILAMF